MPNGFEGSEGVWRVLDLELQKLDSVLERFASDNKLHLEHNYHDWPSRQLTWQMADLKRAIHVTADGADTLTLSVWVTAWSDVAGRRLRRQCLQGNIRADELSMKLQTVLTEAYHLVNGWEGESLV